MADGPGKWTHGANAVAAITTAAVAAVGLGVTLWHSGGKSDEKPAPAPTSAAAPAPAPSPAPHVPAAKAIAIEPVSTSLAFVGDAASDGSRTLQAILTVRIRNDGAAPLALAWLDARRTTSLALNDGTRLSGSRNMSFSGFPECNHDRPKDCSGSDMVTLVPTQEQLATITLSGDIAADAAKRVGSATSGTFTGRLAVRPAQGEPYASPVSLEKVPLTNAAR